MSVEHEIARLETLSSAALRSRWVALTDNAAPKVSPKMLRLALAWEIQARASGGYSREMTRMLDQLARGATKTAPASAGMRLVREWQGRVYIVIVGEDQVIRWDGKEWRSLSEVAREITGARWSGPAFFGLKKKVAA